MTNKKGKNAKRLPREIVGLLLITAMIALFFWGFLYLTAESIAATYYEERNIALSQVQWTTLQVWMRSISFLSAMILFLVLFLFLLGQKLSYLREIIQGVEALRMNRLDYAIPLREENELTELAERINFLSETERRLRQRETALQEERERLIRDLSHDIRTPLTTILSYSDYMSRKKDCTKEELQEQLFLVQRKAQQMKGLTDRLLEGSKRSLEAVENGRLLMEQLAGEWEEVLEDTFFCEISLEDCPQFRGELDIQELRRIFDNLSSNVEKYADREKPIFLHIAQEGEALLILQKNTVRRTAQAVESSGIGLESIRRIAEGYGGGVRVTAEGEAFQIEIMLPILEKN